MGRDREKLFSTFVWINVFTYFTTKGAVVTNLEPRYGSLAGESRLTIYGSGFSADQFSQNDDPNVGNKVYLVGESGSEFSCNVHKDGTTEMQIMCYTPKGLSEENYYVKVVVDGEAVADDDLCNGNPTSSSCTHKPKSSYTPTIDTFSPQSGLPGTFVTMYGKLFSDRYGSNLATATNGKEQKLLRVYAGPQDCGLKDGDDFFELALNDEDSDYGTLMCQHKGTSVGFYNASFIIESPYGRSLPTEQLYRVSYDDRIYLFQVYTNITSISESTGSTAGGLALTIYANYVDDRAPYSAPRAYVGDTECVITEVVTDQYVVCTVAADPQYSASTFAGNRGINFEYWTSTSSSDHDNIKSLTSSDSGYVSDWLDETYHYDTDEMDDYVSKMTTYFTPPHTGSYQFMLNADDGARLYVDGVSAVSSVRSWQSSSEMTLTKGQQYLLEVTHYENGGDSYAHLKVKYFDTKFTSAWTGKAEQELQTISITSDVTYDVQRLDFKTFGDQSAVQEIQTVTVNSGGKFRFGLFGVYTEPIDYEADEVTVSDAVNSLPIFGSEESVSVVREQTDTPTFVFTFVSNRGDFPDMQVIKVANSSDLTFTVTEDTRGEPNLDTVSLTLEGAVSEPFSVAAVDAGTLGGILKGMFEAKCPSVFEGPGLAKYYESFEADSDLFIGTRVKDTEPFCGRYAVKNPYRIYRQVDDEPGIMLSSYSTLCFAYKGFLQNFIGVRYTLRQASDDETVTKTDYFSHSFQTDGSDESTTWYYTCENIKDLVDAKYPSDTEHRVTEVFVYNQNSQKDAYVDSVFIGRKATTDDAEAYKRRLQPAQPNGALIDAVSVTAVTSSQFDVTLTPYECGDEFPLFELSNAHVTSGIVASPSTSVTMALDNGGGSGVMKVTRSSAASPPVIGFIDITFDGNSRTGLNVTLESFDFDRELESLSGIGSLDVTKTGTCANFDLAVTFLTLPGDLPEMTVTYGQLSGTNAAGSIATNTDGGLYYDPLAGDLVSTVHSDPQVRLYINDVPSSCDGDCSFNWDSGSTPTVTGVTPTSGTSALGTSIVISGTGFSSSDADNNVTIADVPCSVTASTTTSITCDVGNGPIGAYPVIVNIAGKGDAAISGSVEFTYTADISSISPSNGSLGGGLVLTISGYGFKSDANVTINSAVCDVLTVLPDQIHCTVPPSTTEATYDVEVEQGETTLTYTDFSYLASLTPTVSSITPSTLSVSGGSLSISGSGFGGSTGTVYLGSQEVTVDSWSDTAIIVEVEVVEVGDLDLLIETSSGLAVDGSLQIPTVTVDLSITNVYPLRGSLQGGTKITLTGSGFGTNDTEVDVMVGDYNCDIDTVSDTEVVCQIVNAGNVHEVTNKGTDPAFGVYYAFDKPYITINVGDYVHWSWETPAFVNNIAHNIYEVNSASSTSPMEGGFSGTPSKDGDFMYQFTETGVYYVWSGFVDEWGIKNYAGTIEVVTASSSIAEISMHVTGIEALHDVGGASDPVDSSSCQSTLSAKVGCVDSQPSSGDAGRFNFAFWTCSTPIINSVDVNNGTAQTTITISGEGFSADDCQNEITFGGYACEATSSSETDVSCTMSKLEQPELGILHQLEMRVGNRGNALISIMSEEDRGFGLIPSIEDIQPTSGSMAGGARITLTGFGFGDNPLVSIGSYQCTIVESSYTEIICETPESRSQAQAEVTVDAYVGGSPLPAECETVTKTCRYSYANLWTPEMYTVIPDSMSSTTTFNITGDSFGTDTSSVEVHIGSAMATITSAQDSYILASIDNIAAGDNDVVVRVVGYGKASGSLTVYGTPVVTSVSPSSGSIHGETTITIQGNGFVEDDVTVTVGGTTCDITSTTLAEVVCVTDAHAAGSVDVDVTSNGESYSSSSFSYASGSTPTISSVSPVSGLAGDTLTISGSNFANSGVTVTLDGIDCAVSTSSTTQIQCTLGAHATGSVPVSVFVDSLGASNTDVTFEYELTLSSVSPTTGGTAGGQSLVLVGSGFTEDATVTVCGVTCPHVNSSATEYTCKTPASSAQTCSIAVTVNGLTDTLTNIYTYDAALTPSVSGVTPTRGGTGGGTTITITGSGFGSVVGDVSVEIDNVECVVSDVSNTDITCVTGPHMGSVDGTVEVQVSGNGIAEEAVSGDADFSYIDVWSSTFTWGGGPVPQAGEFVIIPAGMTLLLDTDTPILSFLLIQGGKLIFDDKDVELQSNIIMITDGGLLQVGTEDQPFQDKGIITLHGHHRSKELPIYGTKVLAVRNGTLDLHGIEVPITWTKLAATANSGDTTLQLVDPVEWNVGDEIVIAASGHKHTQSENEKKTISAISVDKMTLTLTEALEAGHWGTEETFDGTLVEFRAEVGLLTHNVVVRGNQDPQWEDDIKACEAGFDTGEFATQTCFLGRFGDEIGSSQFGAMILVHAPVFDTHEAQARISYTEVFFAGQAFRLGRYPIHFHLNGDMSTSYVRGCGIHKTFNRAVNIHGTHNTMVEKTVIYDIMGGAFFLEDGVETGNTLQYNLAVFVRESSSLLNDDITPASFWVTNPNNTIQHNAAAGGTHFGYWYRMHNHPDGPSFTSSVCPKNVPLGVFYNNSAHSFGWFGLWIFEDYFPLQGGCGGTEVEPAVFEGLFSWNNDKGAEAVNSGALQFKNFVLVQNKLAGYEGKKVLNVPPWTDNSPMIRDSLIVGTTTVIPESQQGCTRGGIVFPYGRGFRAIDIRFVNFASSECTTFAWTRIAGTCSLFCGGYTYHTEGISFVNSPNKARYAWDWEGIILDKDGTLTGKPDNWTILPTSGSLPTDCEPASEFSIGEDASMCPPEYKWHRFAFNNIIPESIEGKNFIITNEHGNSSVPFAKKRLSHKPGWMCALVRGATYTFHFENAAQIKNISFTGQFYDFETSDYIFMKLSVKELPDRFSIDGGNTFVNMTSGGIDPVTAENGDWEWDNINDEIKFVVHGRQRSRRGMSTYSFDRPFSFTAFKCFYTDCIPPPDPNTVPPATDRPAEFDYWDDTTIWNMTSDGYLSNIVGTDGLPQDYDNVRIATGTWMLVNMTQISKIGVLLLEGVLEFFDTPGAVYEIEADHIVIIGGRLIIGWPEDPFDGLASITLRGNHSSSYYIPGEGPTLGAKAIGVFGGLDLFGRDVGRTWTQLATTATAGSDTIVLLDQVNWEADDEIVLGPTSFNVWETESFKITSVAADNVTVTLNDTLKYKHVAHFEQLSNGQDVNVSAPVGLLTHNIKIIGEDYSKLYKESFGARVLVGLITTGGSTYTGYARLSNVEFYHTGQEGFTEEYDPRFSVAYVAVGTVSDVKPSKVTKCSFHNGFNTAVGAFGIGSLEISENVVFGSVGNGLATSSNDTRLLNNLVTLMVATNSYMDRFETFNPRWEAGIEAMEATSMTMQGNIVTGSERIAYHVQPIDCDDVSGRYSNNKVFANLLGVVVLPEDVMTVNTACAKLSGFTAWKNHDFGMYYQNSIDFIGDDNIFIENQNGLISFIIGPSAVGHQFANKRVTITNSLFVGQTSSFDCDVDVTPQSDDNLELSANSRPSLPPSSGMVGLIFPNFYQGSNKAPLKPWKGCMAYNAIGGLMQISGNTFAKYSTTSCKTNYAVSTNVANDDGQHPVETDTSTVIDTDHTNKIIYHRPNVGKVNSADCVDMDCDALKKALFKDLDGTFLGHVGSVIPHSEFEWGGDPRRGLGDYRIPKEMVTDLDGNRIAYDTIAPNKGVIRNDNCTYQSDWQAYECMDNINHEMLIIENMDSDTETRRLSPVAIVGNGYVDLINGPQDHGWCSGYTCRKRLSTFMALVATDEEYLMHFTSTTPEHMRYRLLNVDPDEVIKLTVWYSRPNRLDVFVDDQYVIATNARIDGNGRYILTMPKANEFEPNIANDTGTNLFDKDRGELTFIIKGPQRIDVISQDTIIVSFSLPALTVDDFFGDNIVENLAAFLNIPLTKVRIVNVVSASSSSGRKKRSSSGITVEVEIGDEPASGINDTVSDSISYDALFQLASDIVNECQCGNVSESFNVSGACDAVEVPSDDPAIGSVTYNTPSPDHLFFYTVPEPEYEGVLLEEMPKIRAADLYDVVVTELGTPEYPWQLTVSLRAGTGHPNAALNGTLDVNVTDGWFNFTDLLISHMGTGYILDFNVTYPPEAENFTLASDPFDLDGRPVKIHVVDTSSGDIVRNAQFYATLDLRDEVTGDIISDIAWRDHSWYAEASMLIASPYGNLGGVLSTTFDPVSGQALFPDLNLTGFGMFYVQFRVYSDPSDYNMTLNHKLTIINPDHIGMTIEEMYEVKVKFDVDYDTVLPDEDSANEFEMLILTEYANLWPDVQLTVGSIYEGSIVVTFVIAGTVADVNATAYSMCDSIYNGTSYSYSGYSLTLSPFLTINNDTYYGVTCGDLSEDEEEEDSGLEVYMIVIIAILSLLVILAIIGLIVWRCSIKPKTQTHDVHTGTIYMGQENRPIEDVLFRENTFDSMKFNMGKAPVATKIGADLEKRPLSGFSVRVNTPDSDLTKRLEAQNSRHMETLSPPPAYYDSPPVYVEPHEEGRIPSPSVSHGSSSPMIRRSHSPFTDRDSPLPPVGNSLYHGDYIMSPVPRSASPHLPAPSPKLGKR